MLAACVPSSVAFDSSDPPLPDAEMLVWDGRDDPPDGIEAVEYLVLPYMGEASPEILSRCPRVKVAQLLSAGYEAWIDVLPEGVVLCNGRGIHGGSTAELALLGLLAVVRDFPSIVHNQSTHSWRRVSSDTICNYHVLVLGAGDIGSRVAGALTALGARVTSVGRRSREGVRGLDSIDEVIGDVDAVVVAMPLTAETTRLVDAGFCAKLRDQAIVVNVARGGLVDTEALADELYAKRLRAFLDVVDPEPLPPEHRLWDAPNLLLTPHLGGGTRAWEDRARELIRDQIRRLQTGAPLRNVVRDAARSPSAGSSS